MGKMVFTRTSYTVTTNVEDATRWMTPGRMGTIRKKLAKYSNTEIYNDDICLADSLIFICKKCQNANGKPVEIEVPKGKEHNRALLEVLKEMDFIFIVKAVEKYEVRPDEDEIYYTMSDGIMYFLSEENYLKYLLGFYALGSLSRFLGGCLFNTIEEFQDAIVEGQSNCNFMIFSTDKEARERLDKKAMVKYVRDDGTIRFETYKNAYDYAKRKKEKR